LTNFFLDTNILVYTTLKDFDPEKYSQCKKILKELNEKNVSINISTQILREFYAVVTGKKYLKNPLSPDEAKSQSFYFMSVFNILEITREVIGKLFQLVDKYKIKGLKIHDATIAATMINYDVPCIVTYNRKDFDTYEEIEVIEPGKEL